MVLVGTATMFVAIVAIALFLNPSFDALSRGYKGGGVGEGLRQWSMALTPAEQAVADKTATRVSKELWKGAARVVQPLNQPIVVGGRHVATLLYLLNGDVFGREVWMHDVHLAPNLKYTHAKMQGKTYKVNVVCFDPPGVAGGAGTTRIMLDSAPPQGKAEVKLLNITSPESVSRLSAG